MSTRQGDYRKQREERRGVSIVVAGHRHRAGRRQRQIGIWCGAECVPVEELLEQVNRACDRILARGPRVRKVEVVA